MCYSLEKNSEVTGVPSSYLELTYIRKQGKKFVELAPMPLTNEFLDLFVENNKEQVKIKKSRFPENILYYNLDKTLELVWYNKPQKRLIYITGSENPFEIKFPHVVYVVKGDTFYVFFTDGINNEDKLGASIMPNHFADGHICTGNIKLPKKNLSPVELITAWERVMWISHFTHHVGTDTKNNKKSFDRLLKGKSFNSNYVIDTSLKLKHLFV